MNDQLALRSTKMPTAIREAWESLTLADATDQQLSMVIWTAADALIEVYPPYPPAEIPTGIIAPGVALTRALNALVRAEADASSVEERLRVARVMHLLRQVRLTP